MATVEFKNHIFEWDDNKAELNQRKHGIRFETAVKVFSDENKIIRRDDLHSFDEERFQVIGEVNGILFVVYTERYNSTRIISARKATAKERSDYNAHKKNH